MICHCHMICQCPVTLAFLSHGGGIKGNGSLHGERGRHDLIGSESGLSSVQFFFCHHFSQDTFIWSDGSSLVFDSWRQREPNNRLGNENCVKINYVRLGFWNDTPCQGDKQVRFGVCEKPAVASDSM